MTMPFENAGPIVPGPRPMRNATKGERKNSQPRSITKIPNIHASKKASYSPKGRHAHGQDKPPLSILPGRGLSLFAPVCLRLSFLGFS